MRSRVSRILSNTAVFRFGWGVADQAVSSLENFLLGVYVAQTLGADGLGALGVAMVAYATIVNLSRGVSTDPLMVRFTGTADERWRRGVAESAGTALAVGLLFGPLCVLAGLVMSRTVSAEGGMAFMALGLFLPGLTLQDSWRYAFFSAGQGAKAVLNDTVWTLLLLAALGAGTVLDYRGVGWAIGCFGGTAVLAGLFGMWQSGVTPDLSKVRSWLAEQGDLAWRFVATNVTLGLGGQIRPFVVAVFAGLAAAGAIRGGEMLIGPAVALLMGIAQVAVPEAARQVAHGRAAVSRMCAAISLGLATVSLLWGALVMVVFGFGIGEALLGEVWEPARALLFAIVLGATFGCLHIGPSAGLRALARADLSLRAQIAVTALTVLLGTTGAYLYAGTGAVWGTAIGAAIGAVIWWTQLARALSAHYAEDGVPG